MPWSGGTYTKGNAGTGGWAGDAGLGIGIEAGRHDTQDNDFANGINNALTKDGQNTPTANLGMGGYKHTGVGNATAADEYLSYGQLLDVSKAVTTGGTVPNYTVTLTPAPSAYYEGMTFVINPHATLNTLSTSTLDVNGLGAKDLKVSHNGSLTRPISAYELNETGYYVVTYNATGDYFIVHNPSCGYNIAFTPTVTSQSGTIAVNSNGSTYSWLNNNKILVSYELNLDLSGATSEYIIATLPFVRAGTMDEMPFCGNMVSVTGQTSYMLRCAMRLTSSVYFYRGDSISDFPIDTAFILYAMGVYEAVA